MKHTQIGIRIALLTALLAGIAVADVQVSITLTGDLDEMLGILQQLRRMGYGGDYDEDPLRLRVHSTHQAAEEAEMPPAASVAAPATEEAPPPPKPVIALNNPLAVPAAAPPGAAVRMTVEVVDMENAIDTLAATLNAAGVTVDMFDNGQNGDVAAGDGVWSAMLPLPGDLPLGPYEVTMLPYDANGAPILTATADQRAAHLRAVAAVSVIAPPESPSGS